MAHNGDRVRPRREQLRRSIGRLRHRLGAWFRCYGAAALCVLFALVTAAGVGALGAAAALAWHRHDAALVVTGLAGIAAGGTGVVIVLMVAACWWLPEDWSR